MLKALEEERAVAVAAAQVGHTASRVGLKDRVTFKIKWWEQAPRLL